MNEATSLGELIPLLVVRDMDRSAAFYRERLGFEQTEQWVPEGRLSWCKLRRGQSAIMLQLACAEDGDPTSWPQGVCLYLHCDDADVVHAELTGRGLSIPNPTVAFYGMKQLFLRDPDGYELCFQAPVDTQAYSVEA